MEKKKLLIILVIVNVLLLGVGGTLSAYKSMASGGSNNFEFASIVFNDEEVDSINVDLTDFFPGDTKTINFNVSNNKNGKKSDVTIEYKLIVTTYRMIPTTITIKNSSNQTILTCNTNGTRTEDGKYVCSSSVQTIPYSDNTLKSFTASIKYENTQDETYSAQDDFIEIGIVSEASANNDGQVDS